MKSHSLEKYIHYLHNQEDTNCCTASATLLAAEIIMAKAERKTYFSRLYLYYMTRKLQNRLGQKGAELGKTIEALSIYGCCTEPKWPFSSKMLEVEPGQDAIFEGVHYKAESAETISVDQYKEYLDNDTPIILGMLTGKHFWSLHGPLDQQRYESDGRYPKGHAMTCVGYDDNLNDGSWIMANSFGPRWGFLGYGAIPYKYNDDIKESYVITRFAGIDAGKKFLTFDKYY